MLFFTQTTLEFNDELVRLATQRAAEEGVSLEAVVESALRAHLAGPARTGHKLSWETVTTACDPGRCRPPAPGATSMPSK